METTNILLKNPRFHKGFMPSIVSKSTNNIKEAETLLRKLKRIPRNITAYFDRKKIIAVYKSDCFVYPDNYYLIHTIDDTLFYVEF